MAGDLTKGNIALTISGERTAGFPGLSVTSPSCLSYSRDKVKIAIVIVRHYNNNNNTVFI